MKTSLQTLKSKAMRFFRWTMSAARGDDENNLIDWDFIENVKLKCASGEYDECGIVPMWIQAHWERYGVVPKEYERYFIKHKCSACGKRL
ncbi:hypothetical protein AAVH_13456 [Aphelenchoides avenae]|nr:hypothetical protein AAVH_13456 [Aphelenchus avenae]